MKSKCGHRYWLLPVLGLLGACAPGPASPVEGAGGAPSDGGSGSGGSGGSGDPSGSGGSRGSGGANADGPGVGVPDASTARFSFFYTSLAGMQRLAKSPDGFGGDLRFGEATGLAGADKICQTLAADVGFGHKTWRAFLSATRGPAGAPVHAIDRIGAGPWYDRNARLIAMDRQGLTSDRRPVGDPQATWDLANEIGEASSALGDGHDAITGSDSQGHLTGTTCQDWTNATEAGRIMCGHAFPYGKSGLEWMSTHEVHSCVPGVNLIQVTDRPTDWSIGAGGGWGGFYCFALQP